MANVLFPGDSGTKKHIFLPHLEKSLTSSCYFGYSVSGSPEEPSLNKFAKCLRRRFGIIEGVTDRNCIINSYHVHVSEGIDVQRQ